MGIQRIRVILFFSALFFSGRAYASPEGWPAIDGVDTVVLRDPVVTKHEGPEPTAAYRSPARPETAEEPSGIPRPIHRVAVGGKLGKVITSNMFLRGNNRYLARIDNHAEYHLKYSFQSRPGTAEDVNYGSVYQGIGISCNHIRDKYEIGQPWSFYIFQGARIHRFSPRFSLFYEWNFGFSTNWKPYDRYSNSFNTSIGSRNNAYIGLVLFTQWRISPALDVETGLSFSHYSNGNTSVPNGGLNMTSLHLDLVYNFGRKEANYYPGEPEPFDRARRAWVYDLVLFGSWKEKGAIDPHAQIHKRRFGVGGISLSPLYILGRRVRMGGALDLVYDGSYEVNYEKFGSPDLFTRKKFGECILIGVSGKVEYVMPYFTLSGGMGFDLINVDREEKALYQTMALKVDLVEHTFLHIGYRLQNFKTPKFLMLGFGYRFR